MTSEIVSARADEINGLHEAIASHLHSGITAAIRIGELLAEQKAELAHGEWLPWIEKNLVLNQQQAWKYMAIAENRALLNHHPSGDLTINAACKQIAVAKRKAQPKPETPPAPEGLYDVIVIDPPWPIEKILRDVRPNQAEMDYPTMSVEEVAGLALPTADSCHVWLWTTHKFLPEAFRLLSIWGLKYVCAFVWHKPGGFQPVGLPQLNCEFALYARKGTPKFSSTKAFSTCFQASRGRHSEKPAEFYEIVARVTDGKRLDMFARQARQGFDTWGNEAPNGL